MTNTTIATGSHQNNDKPIFNSYKVNDWLWAGEYPGDKNEDAAKAKIADFKTFGITHFIDLTEEGELKPYKPFLDSDMTHYRFPIIDQFIPRNTEGVCQLIDEIISIHKETPEAKFYIHCWGGVGRTGTIVACFLARTHHLGYEDAVSKLKHLFNDCPKSAYRVTPENDKQLKFIERFIKLDNMERRYTPDRIEILAENEIFVFGSNLSGLHGGGAARIAYERFGAEWGKGVGLYGHTYAIPTMQGGVETIKPYVDEFISFAKNNPNLTFLVTRIGCGIAGFDDEDIAPLFKDAIDVPNIILPKEFAELIADENFDKFHLDRFLEAQEYNYSQALQEIQDGQKYSHWIWFIFPQLAILGHSHNAKYYGISGYEEAEAYLHHPILGERLRHITKVLLTHKDLSLKEILGGIDAMKVCSCMTLFDAVSPDDIFDEVLNSFEDARIDKRTLDFM